MEGAALGVAMAVGALLATATGGFVVDGWLGVCLVSIVLAAVALLAIFVVTAASADVGYDGPV